MATGWGAVFRGATPGIAVPSDASISGWTGTMQAADPHGNASGPLKLWTLWFTLRRRVSDTNHFSGIHILAPFW